MAQRALNQDSVTCSICLEILEDPVTLPCGHSYCTDCIQTDWGQEVKCSCPQCRQSFSPRPVLVKSTVLANLVEELKMTGLITPPANYCYAGPGDVSCDVCAGGKRKAIKSCLQCLVSYCETHLQPHHNVPVLQKHQLVAPSDKLQENLCSEHNEVKKIFCRTDQEIICYLCAVDQHKGHDTVSSAAERTQRQAQLETKKERLQKNLQDKETEQRRLRQEAQDISRSAQAAVQRSENSFREMALLLERRRLEVEQQIRSEEHNQLKQVQELQDQLQQDVKELKKTISELDTLSLEPDHNQFIQLYRSLTTDTEKTESTIQTGPREDFEDMTKAVSVLRDKLLHLFGEFNLFELNTREDFIRYARDITLDPNTVHEQISLSEGNRKATVECRHQWYPAHPDRFGGEWQVMSNEPLTGRCYWEVECSRKVDVAVSYGDIKRKGPSNECGFGNNQKSWTLCRKTVDYIFCFNAVKCKVPGPTSPTIGVYLDHSAGALSFYSVTNNTMRLLHRVHSTFTQPLFAGVWCHDYDDTAHFLKLK